MNHNKNTKFSYSNPPLPSFSKLLCILFPKSFVTVSTIHYCYLYLLLQVHSFYFNSLNIYMLYSNTLLQLNATLGYSDIEIATVILQIFTHNTHTLHLVSGMDHYLGSLLTGFQHYLQCPIFNVVLNEIATYIFVICPLG